MQRDISEFPPFVCGDEHLPEVIAKPERELTIVEKENMDKASARMAELTTFPQYDCIGDWEIVFARNVIKELIAKNRLVNPLNNQRSGPTALKERIGTSCEFGRILW